MRPLDVTSFATKPSTARDLAPRPPARKAALCLSGGGYRAALFHMGALRRLNELGVLGHLDAISAVSGGSILAAHLVTRVKPWPREGEVVAQWERDVAEPFRRFAATDIRTRPILEGALDPWRTAVHYLAKRYEKLFGATKLADLPSRPDVVFCATDLSFGVPWYFSARTIGDYQVGFADTPKDATLAEAVAASSCFPPVFAPAKNRFPPSAFRGGKAASSPTYDACVKGLRLTDGGLYDNMGLEPVWKDTETVLVSDGGATFDHKPAGNALSTLLRYSDVQGNQALALRKRWLIARYQEGRLAGAYWGLGSHVENYDGQTFRGYPAKLVDEVIAEVRTDMDGFSKDEIEVLENHGYFLAEAAIQRHAPKLVRVPAPFAPPHPDNVDEASIRRALRGSAKRKLIR